MKYEFYTDCNKDPSTFVGISLTEASRGLALLNSRGKIMYYMKYSLGSFIRLLVVEGAFENLV